MANVEKDAAIRILKSRKVFSTVGKFSAKVTNVHANEGKFIVNFNAMNRYQFDKAKALVHEGKYEEALNGTPGNRMNLSSSLLPGMYIPVKGELVNIHLDFVPTKSGERALLVTSVSEMPVKSADDVDWGFEETPITNAEISTENNEGMFPELDPAMEPAIEENEGNLPK